MATNQYKNKVVYGGDTLIDLTEDTITADKLMSGYTAHAANGERITGTFDLGLSVVNGQLCITYEEVT